MTGVGVVWGERSRFAHTPPFASAQRVGYPELGLGWRRTGECKCQYRDSFAALRMTAFEEWGFYVGHSALWICGGPDPGLRPGLGYGRAVGAKRVRKQISCGNDRKKCKGKNQYSGPFAALRMTRFLVVPAKSNCKSQYGGFYPSRASVEMTRFGGVRGRAVERRSIPHPLQVRKG